MAYNFSEGATISKIILIFMSVGLYFTYNDESNNNSDSSRQNGGKRKHRTRKNNKK